MILNLESTITLNGLAVVSGPIEVPQKVPEPTTTVVLLSVVSMGTALLLRRRSRFLCDRDF